MIKNIVTITELNGGEWPKEFSNAWINKFINSRNRICFGLYFNNKYPQGFILENEQEETLPDAYIVIGSDGLILEVFVKKQYRGNKVATMLCGWTRSYLLQDGIITAPPQAMTDDARALYSYLSNTYGEPFIDPEGSPFFIVYSDFNGGLDITYVENHL